MGEAFDIQVTTSLGRRDYDRLLALAERRDLRHKRSGRLNESKTLRAVVLGGLAEAERTAAQAEAT